MELRNKRSPEYFDILRLFLFMALGGGLALLFGNNSYSNEIFELNFYQLCAFFKDLPVAQDFISPYYNPLRDVLQYFFYVNLHNYPFALAFCLGLIFGLLMFIMFQTFKLLFDKNKSFYAACALLIFASYFQTQNYTGAISSPWSALCLFYSSLWLAAKFDGAGENMFALPLSGLLMGAAAGLEFFLLIFCAGFIAARFLNPRKRPLIFLAYFLAGFAAASAPFLHMLSKNNIGLAAFAHAGENLKYEFEVLIYSAVCAPAIRIMLMLPVKENVCHTALALILSFFLFFCPPVYDRANAAVYSLDKITFPYEVEEGAAIIANYKKYSFLFPLTPAKYLVSDAAHPRALEAKNVYFLSGDYKAGFLENADLRYFFPGLPASAKHILKDCRYIITPSAVKTNVYPSICRVL